MFALIVIGQVLSSFAAAVVTAIALEWIFPRAISNPTPNQTWIELVGALTEFSLFTMIAQSISSTINPRMYKDYTQSAYLTLTFGFFLMPNMLQKVMAWYHSLGIGFGKWVAGCSSCSGTTPESSGTDPQ